MKMFLLIIVVILVILGGMVAIIGLPDFKEPEIPDSCKGEYLDINGDKIRYYQKGTGPDILLIHGSPGTAEDWEALIPELEKEYRVTVFDRPGQGYSSFQYVPDPLRYNAEVVAGIIKALSLNGVFIMGHSYGGTIALALAVQDIPQAKGFILLSPASFPPGGIKLFNHIAGFNIPGRGIIRTVKGFVFPPIFKSGLQTAFNPDPVPQGYYKSRVPVFYQTKVIVSMLRDEAFINRDIRSIKDYYPDIKKPVLIIHGESDKVIPLYISQELQGLIPGSKLISFKEKGHMIQVVNPEKIKKQIDAFIISAQN